MRAPPVLRAAAAGVAGRAWKPLRSFPSAAPGRSQAWMGRGPARDGRGGLASAICWSPGDAVLTARASEVGGRTARDSLDAVSILSSLICAGRGLLLGPQEALGSKRWRPIPSQRLGLGLKRVPKRRLKEETPGITLWR